MCMNFDQLLLPSSLHGALPCMQVYMHVCFDILSEESHTMR